MATVKVIETKARRTGMRQCLFDSGRPSFRPAANSEMSTAASVAHSSITECSRGWGAISAQPEGPSPIPAARYSMAMLKGRRFNNDPDKAIVVSSAPMITAQVAKYIE